METDESPDELAVRHADKVRKIARTVARRNACRDCTDDLFQEGMIAALAVATRWRPDGGAQYWWLAVPRVHGAMIDYLRSRGGRYRRPVRIPGGGQRSRSVVAMPKAVAAGLVARADAPPDDRPAEVAAILVRLGPHLSGRDRQVLALLYGAGLRQVDIGERLGLSESRVGQIVAAAVADLRRRVTARELRPGDVLAGVS